MPQFASLPEEEHARAMARVLREGPPPQPEPYWPPGMPKPGEMPTEQAQPPAAVSADEGSGPQGSLRRLADKSGVIPALNEENLGYYLGPHAYGVVHGAGKVAEFMRPRFGSDQAIEAGREAEQGNYGRAAAQMGLGTIAAGMDMLGGEVVPAVKATVRGITRLPQFIDHAKDAATGAAVVLPGAATKGQKLAKVMRESGEVPPAPIGHNGGPPIETGIDGGRKLRKAVSAERLEEGNITGAPLDVGTPQAEAARRAAYLDAMEQGAGGREWYGDSGKSIYSHAGDDPERARNLGAVLAITSGDTSVAANAGFAVKGHNQAILGDPVNTGRYPTRMSKEVEGVYSDGGGATGKKRTPFEDQLAIGGGYYGKGAEGQGHRAVHDIWDGEAWGYIDKDGKPIRRAFSDTEHRWMDEQMERVLKTANERGLAGYTDWDPARAQASSWGTSRVNAGKAKQEDIALSYADEFPKSYVQGSRETVPGSNTNHMPELLKAPYATRQQYDDEIAKILYDEKGRDRIAMGNQALVGGHFQGPGIYEGVNPGRQTLTAGGSEAAAFDPVRPVNPDGSLGDMQRVDIGTVLGDGKKAPQTRVMDPSTRALMEANEAQYALLTAQKAYAGGRMFDSPVALRNGLDVVLPGGTISNDRALSILKMNGVDPDMMAIVPTQSGVRIANVGNMDPEKFNAIAQRITGDLGGKPVPGRFDGFYGSNAWDTPQGRYGQEFMPAIESRPVLGQNFDRTAPELAGRIRSLDEQFAREHGFTVSPHIQDLRSAIAANGRDGIAQLVKKLGLGVAALAPMTAAAQALGLLPPDEQQPGQPQL